MSPTGASAEAYVQTGGSAASLSLIAAHARTLSDFQPSKGMINLFGVVVEGRNADVRCGERLLELLQALHLRIQVEQGARR